MAHSSHLFVAGPIYPQVAPLPSVHHFDIFITPEGAISLEATVLRRYGPTERAQLMYDPEKGFQSQDYCNLDQVEAAVLRHLSALA
jgi:hypothetical protein